MEYKWLYPLAWLFGLVVTFRNKLFDWGVFSSEVFPVPVISIGNITVGGTGKTPHTEYLIGLLSNKYRVAVLSRGYKRKTRGFILADENTNSHHIGDEPLQIFRKFPSIVVAVDANRRRGIRNLLQLPDNQKPEVILLDDAFQHRYVKPSLSILLTDSNRPFYDDYLLPTGRLREPAKNYKRADWIIYTKCPEVFTSADYQIRTERVNLLPHQQLFFSSYR
jgi:tetraacyldisaccharide 4'-kinase